MTFIKRRHFLQFAGSTLAAIGLSQVDFLRQANQYGRVLAQGTPRKLALLVGINEYPEPVSDLAGCLTDVQMQYELLVHRFGFRPADILKVTDDEPIKPTRANILQAFNEHLIGQAKPGDVVVFHYSGHGATVRDPNPIDSDGQNGTLVTIDPMESSSGDEVVVSAIMGRTLFLLMEAVQTESLTVVLDSCFSGAGTRGNARVRSATERLTQRDVTLVAPTAEFDFQETLLSRLNLDPLEFQQRRRAGIAKGVAIGSALRNQEALDVPFSGFHAGAFTYLLTRYLWQLPANQIFSTVAANLNLSTRTLADRQRFQQAPVFEFAPQTNNGQQPFYFTGLPTPPAEAAITNITGEQIEFWLGGVSSQNLEAMNAGTLYDVLNASGEAIAQLRQTRRQGLYGYGSLTSGQRQAVQSGQLLREKVLGLPENPTLKVGLDASLDSELPEAGTLLAEVSRVTIDRTNPDYVLGRFTEAYQRNAVAQIDLPPINSLGLFTPELSPLTDSFGRVDETIAAAVNRLKPRLRSLLANQILTQVLVGRSSNLHVTAEVTATAPNGQVSQSIVATRGAQEARLAPAAAATPLRIPSETLIQIKVNNLEAETLYVAVLIIASSGAMTMLYPADWDAPEDAALIEPGKDLLIPRSEDELEFVLQGTSGAPELMMLVSRQPLRNALRGMQAIAGRNGVSRGFVGLGDDSLGILDELLGDLDDLSRSRGDDATVTARQVGSRSLDTSTIAVLSSILEIIS